MSVLRQIPSATKARWPLLSPWTICFSFCLSGDPLLSPAFIITDAFWSRPPSWNSLNEYGFRVLATRLCLIALFQFVALVAHSNGRF